MGVAPSAYLVMFEAPPKYSPSYSPKDNIPSLPTHTVSTLSNRASALRFALPGDIATFLHNYASTQADLRAVDALIKALKEITVMPSFKEMKRSRTAEKHCVRCHSTFTDEENRRNACVIPHIFKPDPRFSGARNNSSQIYEYSSACCGPSLTLKEAGPGNDYFINLDRLGHCFEGSHTTKMDDVLRREGFNKINIRRCKFSKATGECTRGCLEDDSPIFL